MYTFAVDPCQVCHVTNCLIIFNHDSFYRNHLPLLCILMECYICTFLWFQYPPFSYQNLVLNCQTRTSRCLLDLPFPLKLYLKLSMRVNYHRWTRQGRGNPHLLAKISTSWAEIHPTSSWKDPSDNDLLWNCTGDLTLCANNWLFTRHMILYQSQQN